MAPKYWTITRIEVIADKNLLLVQLQYQIVRLLRSSYPEVFLRKGVLKICSKFTGEHPCQSTISMKLLCKFIEIALRHGCSSVNSLHIFRTPFLKNTSGRLLLITPDATTITNSNIKPLRYN